MSGKAYTMREMKSIVDYLTENSLYAETKGRKMWTDYANSKLTTRTWQSLKETFLKRVLPDVTNPYYRLDPDQILSFKRGLDLTKKDKKLEFRPIDKSKNNGVNGDSYQPSSSKNNDEKNATGEDTKCSKIVHDRASTETLILDTCYQTAEDIQKDLESTDEEQDAEKENNKPKRAVKSVRDFIEYTEPLTPMLQEVLDDFATDEDCSDTERPMQIDENYVAQENILDAPANPSSSQSILNPNRTHTNTTKLATTGENDEEKVKSGKQIAEDNIQSVKETEVTVFSQLADVMVLVDEALAKDIDQELTVGKEHQDKETNSFESSIPMTDSLLPNNQEAVKNSSTFGVHLPAQPIGKGNENEGNSKTNLISDEESDPKASEPPIITIDSEERTNKNEPVNKSAAQKITSPKKSHVTDDKVHVIHSDSSAGNNDVELQVDNPCLKSVSLYAEQLVTTKYSDSDSNNKENANNEQKKKELHNDDKTEENIQSVKETEDAVVSQLADEAPKYSEDQENCKGNSKGHTTEGVILVNSQTTSESVDDSEVNHRPLARSSLKMQKDKKLASIFGFSNGSAAKSRRLGSRKRTISHHNVQSDSSEWTSTSDSEYVSPPHGRRNRYARKYLKPRSARVMSVEEEGGLFVMLGKKIYPLVKDGKAVKNYVTFLPESDPEEDDSYWKSKYIEERKRTADLKKKLVNSKSNSVLNKEEKESYTSLSSMASPVNDNPIDNPPRPQPNRQDSVQGHELVRRDSGVLEKSSNKETLKIKFTTNDQEVQLEGHWQHINPVLAQVVSMLHKDPAEKKKTETLTCVELSSGNTTPITGPNVTEVHQKINEIESEIFKEIEESAEQQPQVTQRKKRGRPRKVSGSVVAPSPAKKAKKSSDRSAVDEGKAAELLKLSSEEKLEDTTPNVGRPQRSPRKLLNDVTPKAKPTRKSTAKKTAKPPEAPVELEENPIEQIVEDEEIRYKFPSPVPEEQNKSTKINKSKESPKNHLPITSPDSLSHHSVNSSQGYQDSDTSPFNIGIRRKRRLSFSTLSIKGKVQRKRRIRSFPLLKHVSDESNSSSNSTFKIIHRESTVHSEVYRSDSYQFLMPRRQRLENIDEAKIEIDALEDKIRSLRDEILQAHNPNNKSDPASSSIISLPMSPELSIVENLSLNKGAIAEISDLPTINEIQSNDALKTSQEKSNQYLMTAVDVSMPLMAQQCEMRETYRKHIMTALSNLSDAPNSAGRNLSNDSSMKISISSESILKSHSAVNIETSDSLDRRLEQLLLESAQKPVNQNREDKMEVDTQVKKKGSRKRCSTPHKKSVQNGKKGNKASVIVEEESKAQCSRGGRRSCPPSVNIVYCENNAPDNPEINVHDESIEVSNVTKRRRVKKDIIKVKILKPKDKAQKKKKSPKKKQNVSRSSGVTEVDNESGVFLQGFEDSGDLIHNHSETCLQIGDCMGEDSVEFIETISKSIISLTSSSFTSEKKENLSRNSMESGKTSPDLYCDNAQCATNLRDARAKEVRSADSGNTVYFTPFVSQCNSALTEDLSNEAPTSKPYRSSKWYLLSDEESTTSYFDVQEKDTPSYGANLKQIFPITCAVPDLSTITEMSEKGESQKPSLDVEGFHRDSN